MALQTLNTIKQWFKTGLKPTQAQFWDTWDSFRHKFDKIPVKEVEGLDELLLSKADKTVLDHHLADKNAHAPQVNTDWNSESGFSQLLNKPEFKTINGESLTGDGDIIIEAGGSQDLQTTLANGNETTNGIMFNDDYYNWLKTSIDSRSIRLTDSNSDMLVAIDSAGVVTRDDSQHVSLNPQGIFFNRDTAESYLRINTSSTGVSTVNLPATEGAEITLTATDDFKTINGESIIGEGNLDIEPQGLKSVLDADPTASYGESKATVMGDYGTSKYNELIVSDETEKTGIYQLKNQLSFDHTALYSNDIGNITLSEGNIKLTRDKSNNQTVVDIADPVANTQLRFPAKSEEGKTYTIATTEDFKTINGESIVGSGDILINGGDGNIPTLQEVLDKDRNATNASINLLSEEGESQTTVHEGGLNISEKTETGFLITDINKLGVSVIKDEETTFANISADELSLNKNLSGNPVKQGIVLNEDSAGTSTIKLPLTSDGDVKTLTTTEDFKTINGESIVGEGDITIGGGGSQDLQSILDVSNRATQGNSADGELTISMSGNEFEAINQRNSISRSSSIIRNNPYYLQLSNYHQPSSGSANNISAQFRVEAGEASIQQSIDGFNGQNTVVKFQKPERKDVTLLFPAKRANGEYIIATLDDIAGSQNLQQVLDSGNDGNEKILLRKATISGVIIEKGEDYSSYRENETSTLSRSSLVISCDDVLNFGHFSSEFRPNYIKTELGNSDRSVFNTSQINPTGFIQSYNNGNTLTVGSIAVKTDLTKVFTNCRLEFPLKNGAHTIATTSDFKTINGQSIIGEGDITAGGGTTPDATAAVKGIVKLTGDFGGTADNPTTPTAVHKTGYDSIKGLKEVVSSASASAQFTFVTGTDATNRVLEVRTESATREAIRIGSEANNGTAALITTFGSNATGLKIEPGQNNPSNGKMLVLSNKKAGNGSVDISTPLTVLRDGVTVASVSDLGGFTGNSFTKTGGLATEFLKADGSVDSSITSGTYGPTFSNLINVSSISSSFATYTRIGNIVTVTVTVAFNVTALGSASIALTLPVISTTLFTTRCGIIYGNVVSGGASYVGAARTTSTTTAEFNFTPAGSGANNLVSTFQYSIN